MAEKKDKHYYAIFFYGPGHQAEIDKWMSLDHDTDEEGAGEILGEWFEDWRPYTNFVIYFWEVKKRPLSLIDNKISKAESQIEYLKEQIVKLKKEQSLDKDLVDVGTAERTYKRQEPNNKFSRRVRDLLTPGTTTTVTRMLEALHKANLPYDYEIVRVWGYENGQPESHLRSKILRVLRKLEKEALEKVK